MGRGLDGDQGGVNARATASRARFLIPGGLWLLVFFAIPLGIVLAISFGTTDRARRRGLRLVPGRTTRARSTRCSCPCCYGRSATRSRPSRCACCSATRSPTTSRSSAVGDKHVLIALVVLPFFVNYLVRTYAWVALLSDEGVLNGAATSGCATSRSASSTRRGGGRRARLRLPAFMILPVYAALDRMDPALIEAGKDLYGSRWQTFWHVTLADDVPGRAGRAACSCSCPRSATS